MTTRRWKLACGFLAALTAYSWLRNPAPLTPTAAASSRPGHRGGLRVSAAALGVSSRQLVEQLLETRDVNEMREIAEKLGAVGGDEIIDPIKPLIEDDRPGVPSIAIELYGKVGTDRAVAELTELSKSMVYEVYTTALDALGETRNPKAETFLVGYIADHESYNAVKALGRFESETAIAALTQAAETSRDEFQRYATETIGEIHTPTAQAALRELMDSPNVMTATRAMEAFQELDEESLAKLTGLVRAGDVELGRDAIYAISRAGGDSATAILVEIATDGISTDFQKIAIGGLGKMHTKEAFDTLVKITEGGDGEVEKTALASLARLDTAESREFVISMALGESNLAGDAVDALADLNGPDIDNALLVIAKSDSDSSGRALQHLLSREHAEAIPLVVARARKGGDEEERFDALRMLADAPGDAALGQLLDIVRSEHGSFKIRVFELLGRTHRGDAAIGELLRQSLSSSDSAEATAAANALAGAGTSEARDALISVLSNSNSDLVYAAVRGLDNYRLDDASAAALARAAENDPALAGMAMRKLLASNSPHGMRLAEAGLHSDDPNLQMRTLENLRESNSPAAMKMVEEAVHTTEGEVRATAVRALGDSRDPKMVDVLTSALDDSSPSVRSNVAYALRAIGGEKANNALITMSRSADADDRVAALQSFRDMDSPSVTQRVREMLRDPEPRVTSYAIYTMAGSSSSATELRRMVLDPGIPYNLRYEAATALQQYSELDDPTSEWLAQARANDSYQ